MAENEDPRLRPSPDYGTLGPGSDVSGPDLSKPAARPRQEMTPTIRRVVLAVQIVALLGVLGIATAKGQVASILEQVGAMLGLQGKPVPASPAVMSPHETEALDTMPAQAQAELLLERAINHYQGATDEIAARVDGWYGHVKRTPHFDSLFTTAINANDLRVRAAGIEIDLVVYNVPKTSDSVAKYELQADEPGGDHITAMWVLGLLGNRGVESERAFQVLMRFVHDPDQHTRYWAVESLGYLGTDATVPVLLEIFHDDPSPVIRERAACALAQSGMLSQEQRKRAVPQLLNYVDDASLDAQTRSWVFQALADITGQRLPHDAAAWRNWYSSQR
jgi:hypothetical protein